MTAHPDPEALSAYLDGEAPEWEAHVRACGECRGRLDDLGRVRGAVGAAVAPPDPARRDEAVAAALAAARSTRNRGARQWALVGLAGAVAAAVLAAVLVTRAGNSRHESTVALGPVSTQLVHGGDLGDVDDAQALRARIEPGLSALAAAPQPPRDAGSSQAAGASGGSGAPAAGPAGGPPTTEKRAPLREERAAASAQCEGAARALQPGSQVLVYVATARWQGTPAEVLGFSPPGAPATNSPGRPTPTRVYVLSRPGCRLLVFQSFAP
jgi:hypothetical protein